MCSTPRFNVIEEVGDSRPREWRCLQRSVTARQAYRILRQLRNSSPSARFAERIPDGAHLTSQLLDDLYLCPEAAQNREIAREASHA